MKPKNELGQINNMYNLQSIPQIIKEQQTSQKLVSGNSSSLFCSQGEAIFYILFYVKKQKNRESDYCCEKLPSTINKE